MKTREARFIVTGAMECRGRALKAVDVSVCGFKLKDGRTVRLVVGLEVESKDGNYTYHVTTKDLDNLGFSFLEYDSTDFELI